MAQPRAATGDAAAELEIAAADLSAQRLGPQGPDRATAAASPSAPLPPPVAELREQIARLVATADGRTAELRLDPPELGRVRITLDIADGQVTATLTAEREDVADLMRRHSELLLRDLIQSGFDGARLGFGPPQPGLPDTHDTFADPAPPELQIALPPVADGRLDLRL